MEKQGIKENIFTRFQKQISSILIILVILTIAVNLGLLTFLGTRGEELADIRNQQEEQKLQNDLIRAELERIKVNSQVETRAKEELNMKATDVRVIEVIPENGVTAQN